MPLRTGNNTIMTQINKYADKAAYGADTDRDRTRSAVSHIEQDGMIYDGVNIVVGKNAAGIGDLVVFDKTAGVIQYIKGRTLNADKLSSNLVPMAVVYARKGDKVLIVSLENAKYNGSENIRWAAPYEVALSGFNLAEGGEFTIKINTTNYTFTYAAGATLADIVANIAKNLPNYNNTVYGGWTAVVSGGEIIMTSNTYSVAYSTIDAVSGCAIRHTAENINYQTTLTGLLISGTIESVRRNNRVNSPLVGFNSEKFLQYYSVNGSEKTGQKPGSMEVIRESVFTTQANPDLVAAYLTYHNYLLGEHMMQYPSAYGAAVRDGKVNTRLVGLLRFTDIRGNSTACYPAAAAALDYGIAVDGAAIGLEAGGWWLPSVEEVYLLMRDRVITVTDIERDPVNRTLTRMNKTTCYGIIFSLWSSCEFNQGSTLLYYGITGGLTNIHKYFSRECRPVSSL